MSLDPKAKVSRSPTVMCLKRAATSLLCFLLRQKISDLCIVLGLQDIPTVVGDGTDPKSITDVVRQTRVVVTTAGPYAQFGTELVRACVAEGVHYADLTGEILWMRDMIDKFHDKAAKNHVKIVHTCGFDSIPSDMGTFMVVSYIKEKFGKKTK